jgi:hypothetical protein
MPEIESKLSSSGPMWNGDSSTLPEQEEDTTLILQFFLLNFKVVLESTFAHSENRFFAGRLEHSGRKSLCATK